MTEQWRPIPGWEGFYEVSDHGHVRGLDRVVQRRDGTTQRVRGHLMTAHLDQEGRPTAQLSRGRKVHTLRIHKVVLEVFRGPCPTGMEGCHNDGDKTNNRLRNLRWDTKSANMRDAVLHGANRNAGKTHCISGHELSRENLYVNMRAGRQRRACKECHRTNSRERYRASIDSKKRARSEKPAGES